ncbi:peptidoglycan recognition protein-like [Oncorhynchus keta]|uniref:peptidoglycan recognition protein-like n=1 Tax=Oncorhynchus keta TaxID=8018 RepID=UPI00227A0804|nr:peptidoglycan recognition protein-like [Oncorhynchus keta]
MHMQDRNFDDIGYNFLIGGDCTVYEGRGWGVMGTHTKGNNHNSFAIAFMGNFNNESPSPAAKSSVKHLLQCGVSQGHFHPVFILLGHRDLRDTECPGERLYAAKTSQISLNITSSTDSIATGSKDRENWLVEEITQNIVAMADTSRVT